MWLVATLPPPSLLDDECRPIHSLHTARRDDVFLGPASPIFLVSVDRFRRRFDLMLNVDPAAAAAAAA